MHTFDLKNFRYWNRLLFKQFLIFLFFPFLSISSYSQSVIGLKEAIQRSFTQRKIIGSGRLNVEIQKLQTQALIKKYWPQVSLEYTYLYNPILQTSILPIGIFNPSLPPNETKAVQFGTKWSQNAGLTVVQPLIDFTIKRQIQEFKLQERIANSTEEETEYLLAYDVAQAYFNIGFQEAQINSAIIDTNRTWISYTLQKNKFNSQRLLKSEFNKALINHNNAVQKLKDAISVYIENKVLLLYLIGENQMDRYDFKIDSSYPLIKSPNSFPGNTFLDLNPMNLSNIDTTISLIPDIRELAFQERQPSLQIRSERARYLPTLSLKGFLAANQYTNNFNPVESGTWFGNSFIGIDLKLPIWIGDDHARKIQEIKLQEKQYAVQLEDKTMTYKKDALTSKIKMLNAQDQAKTLLRNIILSKENVKIIQDRFELGQETASNLNLEENNLQSSEASYTLIQKQYWLYYLDYLKASGKLSELWK